jgi:lipoprotein-anchoring transpeptidase ErfK/SrfK
MRVHISIARQEAVLYKDGAVAMVSPVSTGMSGFATPTGEFVVTDKDRMHVSTIYHAEMPYFLRMSCRDFGMHAGVVPGYPASHGCIRLPYDEAVRFFRVVDVGTLVSITR